MDRVGIKTGISLAGIEIGTAWVELENIKVRIRNGNQ